jgi:hypothetical protein
MRPAGQQRQQESETEDCPPLLPQTTLLNPEKHVSSIRYPSNIGCANCSD